ncbi:MAG: YeeE/YedE family protein [Nitrospinota bacterium]|nr:YeeE/YedE family protein [Nitrospinota bacterium]
MDESIRRKWIIVILSIFSIGSVIALLYDEYNMYFVAYIWFGFIYGMCLQYGRFCFSSAFRDLFAVGVPRMVVGIMIATILFSFVSSFVMASGMSGFHSAPFGIHSIIAGLIFGVGMVLAGGCASGSLYKTGEGNGTSLLVVISLATTLAIFVDIGGFANYFVPKKWAESALTKNLPDSITVNDGWIDQFLAGHIWNLPTTRISKMLGMDSESFSGVFFGDFLIGTTVPAVLLLIIVYYFWARKQHLKKVKKERGAEPVLRDDIQGFWTMVISSKRTSIAGLVLGVTAGLHIYVMQGLRVKFGIDNGGTLLKKMGWDSGLSINGTVFDPGYWYVTSQEGQWAAWVMDKLGINVMDNIFFGYVNGIPNPLVNGPGWMSIALIFGAAVIALINNEFKLKMPTRELAVWAILGGFLMGVGSRIGLGCNVGAFFVRTANGDPNGWFFGIGMIGGAYIGVKFFAWWTERQMAKEMAAF